MRRAFKALTVLLLVAMSFSRLFAADREQHLLPTDPNFHTLAPYGKRYAKTCERMLFPASSWMIRYFEVTGNPPYNTGLTIYRKRDGSYWLMVKQAQPPIGDIFQNAFYGRVKLQASLAALKIKTSNRQIPADVALETYKLWLILLRDTRARETVDNTAYIHFVHVILSAKDDRGITLNGTYPPDAPKHRVFTSVEAIVDKLVLSYNAREEDRQRMLRNAAKDARSLRAVLESR